MLVLALLNKIFTREFYRSNAGFFLLVIGLGGGFMRGIDHIILAAFFVSSSLFLLIPIAAWGLYTWKVIHFNLETLKQPQNEFLFHFMFLPQRERWLSLFAATAAQLAPATFYGAFLITVASKYGLFLSAILIALALTGIHTWSCVTLHAALHHPHREQKISRFKKFLDASFAKPYPLFTVEWLIRYEPVMVIGTKIFSIILLWGVTALYHTDTYDLRLMAMGTCVAFAANLTIVWHVHRFNHYHFSLLRQLPQALHQRITSFVLLMIILTLPETGFLFKNFPAVFSPLHFIACYSLAISVLIFLYSILFLKDRDQEQFMSLAFFVVMGWIVLILFSVPVWVLATVNAAIGILLWQKHYYSFEYVSK